MEILLQTRHLFLSHIPLEVGNPHEKTSLAFSQGHQTCVRTAGSREAGTTHPRLLSSPPRGMLAQILRAQQQTAVQGSNLYQRSNQLFYSLA